jgi:hypothetical protein
MLSLLIAAVAATATGCGTPHRTVTITAESKVPVGYLPWDGRAGVNLALSLPQLARLERDIAFNRRNATTDPDLFAPVASVNLTWEVGDRLGTVRVHFVFACSGADWGYEDISIDAQGRERVLIPTTGSTDQNSDTLCEVVK